MNLSNLSRSTHKKINFVTVHVCIFQMKEKVEDPLNTLEKGIDKLEGNIQRSGKIMSSMQKSVEKLKFEGHKPIPPVKQQEDTALVRRPEMQASDVDDGCVFSGTVSGKSANVKVHVRSTIICFSVLWYIVLQITVNYYKAPKWCRPFIHDK